MQFLTYIVVYPIILLVSRLPFGIMYKISDVLCFFVYGVFKYRIEVVQSNLKKVYPDYSKEELLKIEKEFYSHFVDVFLEMLKGFSISESEIRKRYTIDNLEVVQKLNDDGKSGIMLSSHYGNWEWLISLGNRKELIGLKTFAAYSPIKNKYIDKAIRKNRGRFGVHLISSRETIPTIIENVNNKIQSGYGLIADQSPTLGHLKYFDYFLGQKVPVHTGAEKMAKKYDIPVLFIDTEKIKRGHYHSTMRVISLEPLKEKDHAITKEFIRLMEIEIGRNPSYYFWTHKRFKHSNKAPKD